MKKSLFQPTFLIVTDDMAVRAWIRTNLKQEFTIIEDKTASSAVQTANSTYLDFIAVDSSLKYGDPLKLCQELKKITYLNWTPILLITGKLKKTFRDKALKSGVTDFLSSDLHDDELITRIAALNKIKETQSQVNSLAMKLSAKPKELSTSVLKNKLLLNDRAMQTIQTLQKENKTLTVLLIHVDHYEQLEEKHGMLLAQEALIAFSERISQNLRSSDILLPSSGGKFVLILPELTQERAVRFSQNLKRMIEIQPFTTKYGKVVLSASFAINTLEKLPCASCEKQFNTMVANASRALKKTKAKVGQIISIQQKGAH